MQVFAYGSTLNLDNYASRGFRPEHLVPVGRAVLPDYALRFCRRSQGWSGGVLGVLPSPGSLVDGMLFDVDADGVADLDRKEGHPDAYWRREVTLLDDHGREVPAVTYVCRDQGYVAPTSRYVEVVRAGRVAHGLVTAILDRAAAGEPDRPEPVFVYGTLLAGECRAGVLAGLDRTPGRTRGSLVNCGSYPGMVPGDGWVQGELVALRDAATVTRLDRIEGFPGFGRQGGLYRRVLVPVEVQPSRVERAWTYLLEEPGGFPPIPGGSWRNRG